MDDEKKYFCPEHGANCKTLEYLDREQRDLEELLRREIQIKTAELKDLRNSNKQDFEKMETANKENFVSKSEFETVKRLVQGFAALLLLEALRRLFI